MKKCPYCAEEIQDEAIVCRYCGRDLIDQIDDRAEKEPKKKKKNAIPIVALFFLIITILCIIMVVFGGLGEGSSSTRRIPTNTKVNLLRVMYVIEGTAKNVSITMNNPQDGTEQGDYDVPFRKTYTDFEIGDFTYISAQNMGSTGSVTCKIYVNNEVWRESTSQGECLIASCNGLIGND